MNNARTRGRARHFVGIALSLTIWLVAASVALVGLGAWPAYASNVSCAYDESGNGTVTVTIPPGSDSYLLLARSASGDVSVDGDPYGIACTGGDGANPAVSVVVIGASGLSGLDINVANWTAGTSIAVDGPSGEQAPEGTYEVRLVGTEGPDTIDSTSLPFEASFASVRCLAILGLGGDDELAADSASPLAPRFEGCGYVEGGPGNDTLASSLPSFWLYGGGGNDFLEGRDGAQVLWGDDGDDVAHGGAGDDLISGDVGDDRLYGGEGDDSIYGGYEFVCTPIAGTECLGKRTGNDQLFGEEGDDALYYSGGGNDILDGGSGEDSCEGYGAMAPGGKFARATYENCERGEDFVATCSYDPEGSGTVEVTVEGSGAAVSLLRDPMGLVTVVVTSYHYEEFAFPTGPGLPCADGGVDNSATSVIVNGAGDRGWTDVYVHVANWTSETSIVINDPDLSFDDYDYLVLVGSSGPDVLDPANPTFDISGGPLSCLFVFGLEGDDSLHSGLPAGMGLESCAVHMDGGPGGDSLYGGESAQELFGRSGADRLYGGGGSDWLSGGPGDDAVFGGDGYDYLLVSGDSSSSGLVRTKIDGGHDLLNGGADSDECEGYSGKPTGDRQYSRITYTACEYGH